MASLPESALQTFCLIFKSLMNPRSENDVQRDIFQQQKEMFLEMMKLSQTHGQALQKALEERDDLKHEVKMLKDKFSYVEKQQTVEKKGEDIIKLMEKLMLSREQNQHTDHTSRDLGSIDGLQLLNVKTKLQKLKDEDSKSNSRPEDKCFKMNATDTSGKVNIKKPSNFSQRYDHSHYPNNGCVDTSNTRTNLKSNTESCRRKEKIVQQNNKISDISYNCKQPPQHYNMNFSAKAKNDNIQKDYQQKFNKNQGNGFNIPLNNFKDTAEKLKTFPQQYEMNPNIPKRDHSKDRSVNDCFKGRGGFYKHNWKGRPDGMPKRMPNQETKQCECIECARTASLNDEVNSYDYHTHSLEARGDNNKRGNFGKGCFRERGGFHEHTYRGKSSGIPNTKNQKLKQGENIESLCSVASMHGKDNAHDCFANSLKVENNNNGKRNFGNSPDRGRGGYHNWRGRPGHVPNMNNQNLKQDESMESLCSVGSMHGKDNSHDYFANSLNVENNNNGKRNFGNGPNRGRGGYHNWRGRPGHVPNMNNQKLKQGESMESLCSVGSLHDKGNPHDCFANSLEIREDMNGKRNFGNGPDRGRGGYHKHNWKGILGPAPNMNYQKLKQGKSMESLYSVGSLHDKDNPHDCFANSLEIREDKNGKRNFGNGPDRGRGGYHKHNWRGRPGHAPNRTNENMKHSESMESVCSIASFYSETDSCICSGDSLQTREVNDKERSFGNGSERGRGGFYQGKSNGKSNRFQKLEQCECMECALPVSSLYDKETAPNISEKSFDIKEDNDGGGNIKNTPYRGRGGFHQDNHRGKANHVPNRKNKRVSLDPTQRENKSMEPECSGAGVLVDGEEFPPWIDPRDFYNTDDLLAAETVKQSSEEVDCRRRNSSDSIMFTPESKYQELNIPVSICDKDNVKEPSNISQRRYSLDFSNTAKGNNSDEETNLMSNTESCNYKERFFTQQHKHSGSTKTTNGNIQNHKHSLKKNQENKINNPVKYSSVMTEMTEMMRQLSQSSELKKNNPQPKSANNEETNLMSNTESCNYKERFFTQQHKHSGSTKTTNGNIQDHKHSFKNHQENKINNPVKYSSAMTEMMKQFSQSSEIKKHNPQPKPAFRRKRSSKQQRLNSNGAINRSNQTMKHCESSDEDSECTVSSLNTEETRLNDLDSDKEKDCRVQ